MTEPEVMADRRSAIMGTPSAPSATDPWAAIRSAIDQLDGGDAALARATLVDVLRRAAEARS